MKGLMLAMTMVLSSAMAFGGPLDPKQVSAGAKWVVHVDMDQLKGSEAGKFLLTELDKEEYKRKLDAFNAIFNLDPRKDVSSVTVYGLGDREEDNVVLFKGKFDAQRLVTLVKASDGYQETRYTGHVIHSWQEKKGGKDVRNFATLTRDGAVMFAGKAAMEAALDVLDGRRPNIQSAGALKDLSPAADSDCFLLAGANLAGMNSADPNAAILKGATVGQLTVGEKDGQIAVKARVVAATVEAATQMEAIARGLLAFGMLRQAKKPALADMARRATVNLEGQTLTAVLVCPAAELINLIREQQAIKTKVGDGVGVAK